MGVSEILYYLTALSATGDVADKNMQNQNHKVIIERGVISSDANMQVTSNFIGPPNTEAAKIKTELIPVPRNNPGEWASSNDYPSNALQQGLEGIVAFTLQVDADGNVTDCKVTESSGSEELDVTTCSIVQERAHFKPAKDKKGKSIKSEYSNRVRWKIP